MVVLGLGLALTVAPLTSAILGAIDENRSGIASAVNNAVSRVAGLLVVALLSTIVGGTLDLDGFHSAAWVTAALFAIGGVVSWIGIRRNPAEPAEVDAVTPPAPTAPGPVVPGPGAPAPAAPASDV
jgi:MFS family permease